MADLAILAGSGALPVALAAQHPEALVITFEGVAAEVVGCVHRFECLGAVFDHLAAEGVSRVVMAGAMARPPLDPAAFDDTMRALAPRLLAAMQAGDDGLLRFVISLFEERGLSVVGAHELLPALTAAPGWHIGPETVSEEDVAQANRILAALGPLDLGQGVVVAGGLCLGIETLQGTDALLRFVGETPANLRRAPGVLVKRPKPGQDLRVDMPAIGPETLRRAAEAGLAGVVISPGAVLVLDRAALEAEALRLGLFVSARDV